MLCLFWTLCAITNQCNQIRLTPQAEARRTDDFMKPKNRSEQKKPSNRRCLRRVVRRRWPVTMWFVNCHGTEWKAYKEDIIDLMVSGLFGELDLEFPELVRLAKKEKGRRVACHLEKIENIGKYGTRKPPNIVICDPPAKPK